MLTVAAIQCALSDDMDENIEKISGYIRAAAQQGADIVLPSELFCGHYFCTEQKEENFKRALPWADHPAVTALSRLAAELGIVIPVSIFEKFGPEYFNSLVMLDTDGSPVGIYRKSHIPDGPGYMEKFYFKPGDTGFMVFDTAKGRIGAGICWDQWFPEAARAMTLMGADLLLYPTAIGSEPHNPSLDTAPRWQRVMQGHAVANVIPVVAANRVGQENDQTFYGSSFIAAQDGALIAEMDRQEEGLILGTFDINKIEQERASWGFFRDRRTDLYDTIL